MTTKAKGRIGYVGMEAEIRVTKRFGNGTLLALKMEEGIVSQGKQVASTS